MKIKLRSIKSSEHINEKEDGPYRGYILHQTFPFYSPFKSNMGCFSRRKREVSSSHSRDYQVTYVVRTDTKLPDVSINKVMEDRLSSCQNDSCPENNIGTYRIIIRNEPKKYSEYITSTKHIHTIA